MSSPVKSTNPSTVNRTPTTRVGDDASRPSGYVQAPGWAEASTRRPIGRGHEGPSVAHLQQELGRHGFPVDVDGKLGPETEAALRRFQAANGCKVDGMFGPETRAAIERGATTESSAEGVRRRQANLSVGKEGGATAPTDAEMCLVPEGSVRAGDLERTTSVRGPKGSFETDGAGGGVARGDLGQVELPNGATLTGPSGKVSYGSGGYAVEGRLARAERDGMFVDVGRVRAENGIGIDKLEATAVEASTGDSNAFDAGAKLGDVGAEATLQISEEKGRVGAGYRANIAEVNASAGEVSDVSTDDYREQVRLSVGAPSGGAFVSWDDRDKDGARNYKLEVDVPIPGTPLGVGATFESESPIKDGLAVVASFNPITAPAAGVYRLGRTLDLW